MSWFVEAENQRALKLGVRMPEKTRRARAIFEPPFNLVGLLIRAVGELLPPEAMLEAHERVFTEIAKPFSVPYSGGPVLERARDEVRRIEKETGRRAAILCLTSHFPVTEEFLNANPEMMRHVFRGLAAARGAASRPRLVVAVDPFALDLVGLIQEAAYAGFMGTYHVGVDRMFSSRLSVGRALLTKTAWARAGWRLVSALNGGGEIGMVLAGGVPRTARVLYTVREHMLRMRRGRSSHPAQVLAVLKKEADFEGVTQTLKRRQSAWRVAEAYVISALIGRGGEEEAAMEELEKGKLNRKALKRLQAYGRALGLTDVQVDAGLTALKKEYARETPYRERFFRILAKRVVAKGTPVVLLSLAHRLTAQTASPELIWGEPIVLLKADKENLAYRAGNRVVKKPLSQFVHDFAIRFP